MPGVDASSIREVMLPDGNWYRILDSHIIIHPERGFEMKTEIDGEVRVIIGPPSGLILALSPVAISKDLPNDSALRQMEYKIYGNGKN